MGAGAPPSWHRCHCPHLLQWLQWNEEFESTAEEASGHQCSDPVLRRLLHTTKLNGTFCKIICTDWRRERSAEIVYFGGREEVQRFRLLCTPTSREIRPLTPPLAASSGAWQISEKSGGDHIRTFTVTLYIRIFTSLDCGWRSFFLISWLEQITNTCTTLLGQAIIMILIRLGSMILLREIGY